MIAKSFPNTASSRGRSFSRDRLDFARTGLRSGGKTRATPLRLLPDVDDLPTGRRGVDFDVVRDGMVDGFERRRGLDWHDMADGAVMADDRSGYTNLESYLNELVELGLKKQ